MEVSLNRPFRSTAGALFLALWLGAPLAAETITYKFDGIVYNGFGPVPNNAAMHGVLTFDSSVAPAPGEPGVFYFTPEQPASLTLTVEGEGGPFTFSSDLFSPRLPYMRLDPDWHYNGSTYQSDLQFYAYISPDAWPDAFGSAPAEGDYGALTLNLTQQRTLDEPAMLTTKDALPTSSLQYAETGYGWIYRDSSFWSPIFSYNPVMETFDQQTPEPGSVALLGGGLCALAVFARRRKRRV